MYSTIDRQTDSARNKGHTVLAAVNQTGICGAIAGRGYVTGIRHGWKSNVGSDISSIDDTVKRSSIACLASSALQPVSLEHRSVTHLISLYSRRIKLKLANSSLRKTSARGPAAAWRPPSQLSTSIEVSPRMKRQKIGSKSADQRPLGATAGKDVELITMPSLSTSMFAAVLDAREAKVRSDWINTMQARLVREELAKCWREEGVNHYQSCHALAEKYLDMVKSHRVRWMNALSDLTSSLTPAFPGDGIQEARL